MCLITAAFLCVACKGPGSGDKPADISMAPSGVSQPSGNPAQPSTPTPTSTPSPTPTMTPSPTPTPTPIPEEQFVELGNRKNGNTMKVGTYVLLIAADEDSLDEPYIKAVCSVIPQASDEFN